MGEPLASRADNWTTVVAALRNAQKSNRNAAAYSRWVNRPWGRLLAATAFKWGMTPNQVTFCSAFATFPAIVALAVCRPNWWIGLVIAFFLLFGYALDSADGQLARLQGGGSPVGEWLDHVIDAAKMSMFHLAVVVMWVRNLDGWPLSSALVPMAFSVLACVSFFGMILTDQLERAAGVKKTGAVATAPGATLVTSIVAIGADYGFLSLTMCLLGWFTGWRWLYVAIAVFNALLLVVQLVRWYRRMARLPRA